jgi:FtsZ-binding cell division protein ZapB
MIREEKLHEERITLCDGTILIRTEEGIYFQTMNDCSIPLLIDRHEGERLLFQEARRLKERNQQLHRNYNTRAEKYHYLEQENKRLKENIAFWVENSYKWSRKALKGETNESRVDEK